LNSGKNTISLTTIEEGQLTFFESWMSILVFFSTYLWSMFPWKQYYYSI